MKPGAFMFARKWLPVVKNLPETGMGYTVVTITLLDGHSFKQALISSGWLSQIRGLDNVPFKEKDIADIQVTHDKWDWDTVK